MKNLVLVQIAVYLFFSPIIVSFIGDDDFYRFEFSALFLFSFLIGLMLARITTNRDRVSGSEYFPFVPGVMKVALMVFAFVYIYVVVQNGLLIRRQGSDVMAHIHANLALLDLAIIRFFEIIFYPVMLIILVGLQRDKGILLKLLLLVYIAAFMFTGILDSRAKLILPLLFYYIFFIVPRPRWQPLSKNVLFAGCLLVGFTVLLLVINRLGEFDDFSEYLREDIITRLDGLEFSSRLAKEVDAPWWGTWDVNIFANFVASLPFLEQASMLKEMGMTSSKNYLLQNVLGSSQFDTNNSMMTDLYYFGGYFFLILGAIIYGLFVMRFDIFTRTNCLWRSRIMMAFMFSFLINALRIEVDFFGMLFNILRDFCILYVVFSGVKLIKMSGKDCD